MADDQPALRWAVRQSLEQGGFAVCAEVATAAEAIDASAELRPDICLLDIRMPGNGIKAASVISEQVPETAVVMLTASSADSDLFDAIKAGARGYLLKDLGPRLLPEELERVLAGEAVLPGLLAARVLDEFRLRDQRRRTLAGGGGSAELTGREWEVLELLADGLKTREIAQRLFVSQETVRTHVAKIVHKLQVGTRQEAVELFKR